MKGVTEIRGRNIFNDLNYGDMVIVYHNPMYEFMFEEQESNRKKIDIIERRKK
jgi:hypothetical protein